MKISELLVEETKTEYFKRLTKSLNIKKLGAGAYGTVFQHPMYHNVAVKYVEDDPVYIKYINFCLKNQNNKWLPKIVGINKVQMDDDLNEYTKTKGYLVFFQKLKRLTKNEHKKAFQEILKTLPDKIADTIFDDCETVEDLSGKQWKLILTNTSDADLKSVLSFVLKFSLSEIDIHNENVMLRDDGSKQLVFTDPLAS